MRFISPRVFAVLASTCLALLTALVASASASSPVRAASAPFLSPIFGDHMVLQRDKPNLFWGWTHPGANVRVTVADKTAEGVAGPDGKWQVALEVPPVGGPYTLTVVGTETIVLHDLLVGDVWLCGGQSNMQLSLKSSAQGEAAAKTADDPQLRFYTVPTRAAYAPAVVEKGAWKVCAPETAADFSAVAYYYARKLQGELHVPIGLIEDCVGGSPAEAWMSAEGLAHTGEFGPQMAEIARLRSKGATEFGSFLMHWLDENDVGGKGEAWAKQEFDDRNWKPVSVPGGFKELGVPTEPAIVWFRREITLPDPLPPGSAKIFLGVIERMETVYVNGRFVGASSWVENPRIYPIPADALKPGRNVIALRVFKIKPQGGFLSSAETLRVQLGDGAEVPLAGEWKGALSFDARPPKPLPLDYDNYPTMPTVLYNGMIAPVAPLAIAGAIWYQGEANTSRVQQYRKLLPALIADWREKFGQGEFPFYIVSLPAFTQRRTAPGTDGWAELREVQADTVRNLRNTGLAVTIDTGDAGNIHPKEKKTVGDRLALSALAGHYRKNVAASGPTLRFVERRPGALALHFDHADGGLRVHGEILGEFAIAGKDHAWHWAQARIEGDDAVIVSSPDVPAPVAASYAWQGNPLATLFNAAGLPALPFRTDEDERRDK